MTRSRLHRAQMTLPFMTKRAARGVSRARISQIHEEAIRTLRRVVAGTGSRRQWPVVIRGEW